MIRYLRAKRRGQSKIVALDLTVTLQMIPPFEEVPDTEYVADLLKELRNKLVPVVL